MRYYKGDTLRHHCTTLPNVMVSIRTEVLAKDRDDAAFESGKAEWGTGKREVVIAKLVKRPFLNHLRAAWDSIFRP